jgi:NAD(P)-dependent dehydrogenase (short-subunit alcohol dehydrogenase family)
MSKNWLITGASSGLGRLMSERLLRRGDRVVATVRREGALEDLQQEHGDRLAVAILDLMDKAGIRTAVDDAFARMRRIDVVVIEVRHRDLFLRRCAQLSSSEFDPKPT